MTDALRPILLDAAEGRFPTADGDITVVPPDVTTGLHAVISFTGHAVIATDRPIDEVRAAGADGLAIREMALAALQPVCDSFRYTLRGHNGMMPR